MLALTTSYIGKVQNCSVCTTKKDREVKLTSSYEKECERNDNESIKQTQLHSFLAINTSLYLFAAVESARNQCIIQLVRGLSRQASNCTSDSSNKTKSTEQQCSKKDVNLSVNEAHIPIHILAALRIPHIIQVIEHQEGKITTLSLALYESSCIAADSRTAENENHSWSNSCVSDDNNGNIDAIGVNTNSYNNNKMRTHVLLFIGTLNGTMLVCNALRGTILVIARFNEYNTAHNVYNKEDSHEKSENEVKQKVHTTAALDDTNYISRTFFEQRSQSERNNAEHTQERVQGQSNDAIAKFAMVYNSCSHDNIINNNINNNDDVNSNHHNTHNEAICHASLTSCKIKSVYVVHASGKVVVLDRNALDVLVKVIVERQDGRRPYFFLESPLERAPNKKIKRNSFPTVGPGYAMTDFINCTYTLSPPTNYSSMEMQSYYMTSVNTSVSHRYSNINGDYKNKKYENYVQNSVNHDSFQPARLICDAVVLPLFLHREINFALETGLQEAMALLICGCFPAFALYTIDNSSLTDSNRRQSPLFLSSAREAVHAMKFVVSGFAKSLWHNTIRRCDEEEQQKDTENEKEEEQMMIAKQEEKSEKVHNAKNVAHICANTQSGFTDNNQGSELSARKVRVFSHEEEIEYDKQNQQFQTYVAEEAEATTALSKQMTTRALQPESAFLQADVTFSRVELDGRSGYTALYAESQGRLFIVDSHTAIVHRILKGCRAATFQWCEAKLHSSSSEALSLLLVHLPLRHLVEVYSLKAHKRIACCHISQNAVLLNSTQMHCHYPLSIARTKCNNAALITTLAYFLDPNEQIFCVDLHACC